MKKQNKIRFGFPWEYLREGAVELFKKAGYKVKIDEHSYRIEIDDPEIECITNKVEELAPLVEKGIVDVGITEKAFILDSKAKVIELVDLNYGYKTWHGAKVVLAVPENSKIKSVKDLKGKKIATWIPETTRDYLRKHRIKAKVEFTNLPAESKCPAFVDGVIEFVNTGHSLRKFHLKIIDVLMETSPWLIANKKSWRDKWKKEKIENLAILLRGARLAQEMTDSSVKGCPVPVSLGLKDLNETDFKIIEVLLKNGRRSFTDIARETNLTSAGIKNRVEKLIKNGTLEIKGLINLEKFYSVSANIGIGIDSLACQKLIKKLSQNPLVYNLMKVSGSNKNLIIDIVAPNMKAIEEFLDQEIRSESGIRFIEVNTGNLPIIPKTISSGQFRRFTSSINLNKNINLGQKQ